MNRLLQRFPDRLAQALVAGCRYLACGAPGVDARAEQRFRGVDISHANDDLAIHDEFFDADAATFGGG